jgi:outer membrane protein assembly factor BamC
LKYRVVVRSVNGKSEVSVLNAAGQAESSPISQRILKLVADDLR